MADKTIPSLVTKTSLVDADMVPVDSGIQTYKTLLSTLRLYVTKFTTLGDLLYSGASGASTRLAGWTANSTAILTQAGNGTTSAAPAWREFKSPTRTRLTTTGTADYTQIVVLRAGSAGPPSMNATVGATYTSGGGNVYTVLATVAAQKRLYLGYTSGPVYTSGSFTKVSGTGDASLSGTPHVLSKYTVPAGVKYLRLRMHGSGSGGVGSANTAPGGGAPSQGADSIFINANATVALFAFSGGGNFEVSLFPGNNASGQGGPFEITGLSTTAFGRTGQAGNGMNTVLASQSDCVFGAPSSWAGYGYGGNSGIKSGAGVTGSAGGAGGFVEALISAPEAAYWVATGVGGTAGSAGTGGNIGQAGGDGIIDIEEFYQ